MVLKFAEAVANKFFPYQYAYHILIAIVSATTLRAFSQGRTTNRERDLHNRTFLVTGVFTPTGLTFLQSLAERGAKIIALSPYPIDSPTVTILISLLRTTYNNDEIYAEQCDLANPTDIRNFCMRFLTEGEEDTKDTATAENPKPKATTDKRLDGIVFAHEYQHIGVLPLLRTSQTEEEDQKLRDTNSLATFLIITLLLPALLIAPVERDIRIINVVNPFYSAAAASIRASGAFDPTFSSLTSSPSSASTSAQKRTSIFPTEGLRSLRSIILTRHLQRIFDALPSSLPPPPQTAEGSSTIPVVSPSMQRSNLVAVSVSPGLSRVDTVSRLFNADWSLRGEGAGGEGAEGDGVRRFSWFGVLLYVILLPLLHLTTKSPKATIQTILHALFLPTPFKILSQSIATSTSDETEPPSSSPPTTTSPETTTPAPPPPQPKPKLIREELLKPGALYAECAVVNLALSLPTPPTTENENKKEKGKEKEKETGAGAGLKEEVLQIADDGEYGGEYAGRVVWEAYEAALKIWERSAPAPESGTRS